MKKIRILAVDPSINETTFARMLLGDHFDIEVANSCEEATIKLRAIGARYHFVIIDGELRKRAFWMDAKVTAAAGLAAIAHERGGVAALVDYEPIRDKYVDIMKVKGNLSMRSLVEMDVYLHFDKNLEEVLIETEEDCHKASLLPYRCKNWPLLVEVIGTECRSRTVATLRRKKARHALALSPVIPVDSMAVV